MAREIRKIKAEGAAYQLTRTFCLDTPGPVPVEDIAMDAGILCLEAKLTGCLARLVRQGDKGIIRTHSGIKEVGRKRFAIAHELGHWFLHAEESQYFICTAEQMRDYKGSPIEVEANLFASELLMPAALFRPLVQKAEPSLESIKDLSGVFQTSLTATGMKFVDSSNHECILILSKSKTVTWSKQREHRSGLRIEKGMPLSINSLAYHATTGVPDLKPEVVEAEAWIAENYYGREIEVTEQSWALDGYDSVLTLLIVVDA